MTSRPALAKSELEVARIVWQLRACTVREAMDAMPDGRDLEFKTVQTYLRRLEAKGYLSSRQQGRSKVYRPRVKPKAVVRQLVDDFLLRLFDGEALPLLQNLIEDRGLNEEELQRLRKMLEELPSAEGGARRHSRGR